MAESYEALVEREGGYYLRTDGRYGGEDVTWDPCCAHCGARVDWADDTDYKHQTEAEGKECWERRQAGKSWAT